VSGDTRSSHGRFGLANHPPTGAKRDEGIFSLSEPSQVSAS
jgi:hypothetical protein